MTATQSDRPIPEWSRITDYESTLSPQARRSGVHYTPWPVAVGLSRRALTAREDRSVPRIIDPSCGAGAFLVASAEVLVRGGADPSEVLANLTGIDVDGDALLAADEVLAAWADRHGVQGERPVLHCGDALSSDLAARLPAGAFELVLGNPPFQNQLAATSARTEAERAEVRQRFGPDAAGYADTAALFLLLATELVAPGGVIAMIQPRSVLAARSTEPTRARLSRVGHLIGVWVPDQQVFEAAVDVCAVVAKSGPAIEPDIVIWSGPELEITCGAVAASSMGSGSWSAAGAIAAGVPSVPSMPGVMLGDHARLIAGFRDEYYAVVEHLVEQGESTSGGRPVVSVGLIEPARIDWGHRPARIGRRRWDRPVVEVANVAASNPRAARWLEATRVSKTLVATQTRVLEAAEDRVGDMVPLTPVVAVISDAWSPAAVTAAVLAPAASAWAHWQFGGTGMSRSALRVSARQLRLLPMPVRPPAWRDMVRLIETNASWEEFGRAGCASWDLSAEVSDQVMNWWLPHVEPLQ